MKAEIMTASPTLTEQEQRVQKFVEQQMARQINRTGKPLEQLATEPRMLSANVLDVFVDQQHESLIDPAVLEEVKRTLTQLMKRINSLPAVKRFYILETMDLFHSKISLGKLLPPLLLLEGEEQNKAICEFIKPTFLSINKNVEILTSVQAIFSAKSIHLERGSLYTFVGDVARVILKLFDPNYLYSFPEINSNVELAQTLMEVNPIFQESFDPQNPAPHNMIQDRAAIRRILMEFVECIQTHEGLYNYAIKRHAYYKLFVTSLLEPGKFQGFQPWEVSQILAACLYINPQLDPPKPLLDKMLSAENFAQLETKQEYNAFVDQLTPSVVYRLIGTVKTSMQQINKNEFEEEFSQVHRLSVRNILRNAWAGFLSAAEKLVKAITSPIAILIAAIKSTFESFMQTEGQSLPVEKPKGENSIPRNPTSANLVGTEIKPITTDIKAFRGEYDGASQKDYTYNSRLFKQNEMLSFRFRHCFERLFKTLQSSKYMEIYALPNNPGVKEYYIAFQFKDYLMALGLTHLKTASSASITSKDLFPYVLLFQKAEEKSYGRVLSRQVEGQEGIYNEVSLTGNNAKVYYEVLFHLFHHLSDQDWKSKDAQEALRFLVKELEKIAQLKQGFLYLNEAPSLQ